MLTGSLWEAVCALVVGLVGHFTLAPTGTPIADLTQRNKRGGEVVIAFAVLHVFAFAMFWGPAPWVYLGESFPLRVRAKGIALGSASSASFASLLGWAELTRFFFPDWFWNFMLSFFAPRISAKCVRLLFCTAALPPPPLFFFGSSGSGPAVLNPPLSESDP